MEIILGCGLNNTNHRSAWSFLNLDTGRESLFEGFDMGDHQDLGEIAFDGVDRFDQPLAAEGILATKAFVDHQGL